MSAEEIGNTTSNYPYPRIIKRLAESGEWEVIIFAAEQKAVETYNSNCKIVPYSLRAWIQLVLCQKIDLVLVHLPWHIKVLIMTKLLKRVPLILRYGGINGRQEDMLRKDYVWKRRREWLLYKFCDYIVSTADGTPVQLHFLRMGVPRSKYTEWLNGFRPLSGNPVKREKEVLYLGRICRVKALNYIIDSFKQALPNLEQGYKLILCGTGHAFSIHEEEVRQYVICQGLEDVVEFHPWTKDSSPYYRRASMVITGCANNQVIESYVTGTPVIALDLGETKEIYGHLKNIHIVDYPLGGYPLLVTDAPIREDVYDDLVRETARLMVKISGNAEISSPDVDYKEWGWKQRVDKEISVYKEVLHSEVEFKNSVPKEVL